MGAFIGFEKVGVWVSNGGRDQFLDWFAENRCTPGDARWEFCKSEANRWTGCGIDLADLVPRGERFDVTAEEVDAAAEKYSAYLGELLVVIGQITRGEWKHRVESEEAVHWTLEARAKREQRRREQDVMSRPTRDSSRG